MTEEVKQKRTSIYAEYDFGKGFDFKAAEGHELNLWGVKFKCDGKGYKATLSADEAKAMIEAGRARK